MVRPRHLLLALLALGAAATDPAARAQPVQRWDDGGRGQTVVCSSDDRRQRQCPTPFRGRARLVENISGTRCVEGHNWGSSQGRVWVSDGCRARFAEGGGGWDRPGQGSGDIVRCESNDRRERACSTRWRSARLVRQLSGTPCVEGGNWYSRQGEIRVRNGCRGEFAEARGGGWGPGRPGGNDYSVTCSSDSNRPRTCNWDRRQGRPYVIQQLSGTRCEEGRNWGYERGSLWVDRGCRARFGAR